MKHASDFVQRDVPIESTVPSSTAWTVTGQAGQVLLDGVAGQWID